MTPPGAHVTCWHSRLQDPCPWKSLYHLKPQADTVVILWVEIHDFTQSRFLLPFYKGKKKKKRKETLSVSLILWSNLLSHSNNFFLPALKMSVNQGERKRELSAGLSLSAHIVFCQKPGKHLVLPCSHWVAHWHPLCLPWVSNPCTSLYITVTTAGPPLPALMARRDAGPQPPALPRCSSMPSPVSVVRLCSSSAMCCFVFFFSLKWEMRIFLHYNL